MEEQIGLENKRRKENNIIDIIKLAKSAFGDYKIQISILIGLSFLSGVLEGIGINALIPIFSFVIGDGKGGEDVISEAFKSFFGFINLDYKLKYLLIFVCFLFILKAILVVIYNYIKVRITADYEEKARIELLKKILEARWSYLLRQKLGYLDTILNTDVRQGSIFLHQLSGILMMTISLLIYIFVALNISASLTVITIFLGLIFFLSLSPFLNKMKSAARETSNINKQVAHQINENILGMKTVKTMSIANSVIEEGKKYFSRFKELRIKTILLSTISSALLEPFSLIFICVVFAISSQVSNFNLASFLAVMYLIQRIFLHVQKINSSLQGMNDTGPYLENVLKYKEMAFVNKEKNYGTKLFNFNENLTLKDVCFSYNNDKQIIKKISFSIKKGEMVGLIGPSGVGKTTIVDLILRLFNPDSGDIFLDEVNISEIDIKDWRKNIGYVSQDIFLKNDTIANNIKFYDDSISDETMENAAKMANIYNFIESCPNEFSTVMGERGIELSAGQRQRIVIARILARKPKFLIFDEATSALDNESEVKIQKVIEELKGKITVLVIAHRLSTIINSDKLLVLKDGKIVEEGVPKKLLEDKDSYFYKVYNIRKE